MLSENQAWEITGEVTAQISDGPIHKALLSVYLVGSLVRGDFYVAKSKPDLEAENEYQILRRQSIRIGTQDLRIAAIARVLKATLVTHNRADFEQIPELRLEDGSFSET